MLGILALRVCKKQLLVYFFFLLGVRAHWCSRYRGKMFIQYRILGVEIRLCGRRESAIRKLRVKIGLIVLYVNLGASCHCFKTSAKFPSASTTRVAVFLFLSLLNQAVVLWAVIVQYENQRFLKVPFSVNCRKCYLLGGDTYKFRSSLNSEKNSVPELLKVPSVRSLHTTYVGRFQNKLC